MGFAEIARQGSSALLAWADGVLSSPTQILAHLAAALALVLMMTGALMRTMLPLRWLAVGGNLGLALYGALHPAPMTLAIALVLLPVNLFRAVEVTRLTRRVSRAAAQAELAGLWLRPYMKQRRLKAGQTLFHKGDRADWLYLLLEGQMELADIGQPLEPGRIFGEIALFSPDHQRTHTARCLSACTVLQIHASTVRQLYYQHPAFGMHLIELLTQRLSSDVARAEGRQAQT